MSVEDMIKLQARRGDGLGQTNDEYTSPIVKEILTRITQIEAVQNTLLKRVNGFKEKSGGADQEILARLDKVEAAVRSISIEPEDVEKFKQMGLSAATEVNEKLQESGDIAADKIRQAGRKSIKEFAIQSFFTAAWFVVLTLGVQYFVFFDDFKQGGWFYESVAKIGNSINMIHFNQTMPGANYTFWDFGDFVGAWANQDKYIKEQRKQAGVSGSSIVP